MITLLLFGQARSAAGTGTVELDAVTLSNLLDQARARFGPDFQEISACSAIWVNGEQAPTNQEVRLSPGDEIALLPPIAGG